MREFFLKASTKLGIMLTKLYIYLIVVMTPIIPSLLWLGVFVAIDLLTGILIAKRANEAVTSKKLSRTVSKLLLYFAAIICSHILDTQFLKVGFLPATIAQLVSGFIAVVEFKSIIENISILTGVDLLKFLKSKIYRSDEEK